MFNKSISRAVFQFISEVSNKFRVQFHDNKFHIFRYCWFFSITSVLLVYSIVNLVYSVYFYI